MKVQNT